MRKILFQILGIVFVSFLFLIFIMKLLDLSAEAGNQAITEFEVLTVLDDADSFVVVDDDEGDTKLKQITWSNLQLDIVKVGTIATGAWDGTDIPATAGGTGASTLTDGGIMLGSGTGAITPMAVLADGEIIVGDGTTDPVALAAFTTSTGTLKVANGGTGVATLADGGLLVGNVAAAIDVLAPGATTDILVGGGAATAPVWTAATGSGSPVRATSPSLTTPLLGTPTSGVLTNCTNKLILGTEQATTSGTTIDFTGIPAGVKQIIVSLDSVSTDGTGGLELTLGTAGGFVVTGYVSRTIRSE